MAVTAGFARVSAALEAHLEAAYAAPEWRLAKPVICNAVDDFAQADSAAGSLLVALFHIGRDTAARSASVPVRGAPTLASPPVVWDLHYLVAARAGEALVAQQILGCAARRLHRHAGVRGAEGFDAGTSLAFVPVEYSIADTVSLWQGLGQRLQPCLVYRVRCVDVADDDGVQAPVTQLPRPVPLTG